MGEFSGIGGWSAVDAGLRAVSADFATTAQFAGSTPGLVPSASPSDSAKALLGDGTWGAVGGGGVNMSASYDSATETFSIDFSNGGN